MAHSPLKQFIKDARKLTALPLDRRHENLRLFDYPFDLQLLTASPLYRASRSQYLDLGGRFSPRLSSTMRSLSAQDLFADEIDYSPAESEILWFASHHTEVYDPAAEIAAIEHFNTISIFHEQNHRIVWQLLPPAPRGERDVTRYLNFAESLVVMLDLALADQVGAKFSPVFERMKVLYRTGVAPAKARASKVMYRNYLLATFCATYFILELTNPEDILKAVNYVLPDSRSINRAAVLRALDISELFTRITNPQWQERYWQSASTKLTKMHRGSHVAPLELPAEALDLDSEFAIVRDVLKQFGL